MKNIFFTADMHFGHKAIIESCKRPFSDIDEMDFKLVSNWNDKVSKEDVVYVVGDAFWTDDAVFEILPQLNGRIFFMYGNHDSSLSIVQKFFTEHVVLHNQIQELKTNGTRIIMCHYPLATWNLRHQDSIHVHGHVHNNFPKYRKDTGRRINISVEHWDYAPIALEEILDFPF